MFWNIQERKRSDKVAEWNSFNTKVTIWYITTCAESLTKFKDIISEKEYWEQLDEIRYEETISCKFCNRILFDKQKKERHIQIVDNKNPDYLYACDDRSKAFGSKQALQYHVESILEKVNLQIPCSICEKRLDWIRT